MFRQLVALLLTLACLAPISARPRSEHNPGADRRTPAATYVKYEALTQVQQQKLAEVWQVSPAEAAIKWNALKAADQRDLALKYAFLKVASPRP